ncbi:MAG: thioredoxin domain-containing protein [Flavobacteriales bacterium]|nr:thioredoxin domain-containing protein [Flavobacteriales bacterium]
MNTEAETSQKPEPHKFTNALIHESSPYLLQHAHNPVDWRPWNEETLALAKKQDKMLLISIGYAACHWCHVMEHESFEDEEVAQLMNEFFIPVKVDREERPDVDQIYMSAIQVMGQNGGWPLNFFALPDGRPFWGGTYFQKPTWMNILRKVHAEYINNKDTVIKYADELTKGVVHLDDTRYKAIAPKSDVKRSEIFSKSIENWKQMMDNVEGGPKREQNKFPLPNAYNFLMKYGHIREDAEIENHIRLTLKKLAFGGIYDQVGGGFARYSVDKYWKVPHFEKMLYDNAQLVSLYSEAYTIYKDPLYKSVVEQTADFILRELTDTIGAFYASLDADSEGEEGKFYVWSKEELKEVLQDDYKIASEYFEINPNGFWEGNYILVRDKALDKVAKDLKMDSKDLKIKIQEIQEKLLSIREDRIRPGLDDKSLCSWNALMCGAFLDAYRTFGNEEYLAIAKKNLEFTEQYFIDNDGRLFHNYKNGKSSIKGFLEDYAHLIATYIKYYQTDFKPEALAQADALMQVAIDEYYDGEAHLFYFTSKNGEHLVSRKFDIDDNVIASPNSVMAKNLYLLSYFLDRPDYLEMSRTMVSKVVDGMDVTRYPLGYANWLEVASFEANSFKQVVVTGEDFKEKIKQLDRQYIPYKILVGATKEEGSVLLKQKHSEGKTLIYICENKTCKLPTEDVNEAIQQLKN